MTWSCSNEFNQATELAEGWSTWWNRRRAERSGFSQHEENLPTVVSSCLKKGCREDGTELFSDVHSKRTEGNSHNLQQGKSWLNIRKKHSQSVVNHWHDCPERLCNLHPWRFSKHDWTKPRAIWSKFEALSTSFDQMTSRGLFQPNLFHDFTIAGYHQYNSCCIPGWTE